MALDPRRPDDSHCCFGRRILGDHLRQGPCRRWLGGDGVGETSRNCSRDSRHQSQLRLPPGINLPKNLGASTDMAEVLQGAHQVYLAVPSQHLRANLRDASAHIAPDALVVSLMKGVEAGTGLRMSEVIAEEGIETSRIAVVSGPNLALEIAREQPTAAVASSDNAEVASAVASAATNP